MKRIFLTALFVFIGSLAFAQERIAVFPFEDRNNVYTKDELDSFYVEFSNEFANKTDDRRFTVLARDDLEKLINMETRFQLSDYSSKEKTAELNRVLNAQQILYCLILKVGNEIRITVSRRSFPELTVLRGGKTISVTNKNQLFGKIPELVQAMVNEIAGGTTLPQPNTTGNSTPAQTAVPANFVRVEGGTFQMKTPSGVENTVTVKSFIIGKHEVTQREWQEIMGNNPSYFKGANLPVEQVSWYDALEYCNKRSVKEGLTPVYRGSDENITCDWNANGYRLPSEVEWEFAARGGTKEHLTTVYSGSNSVGTVAWYEGNSGKKTQPVGTKAPNSLGLYDMSGNVWEWCWDWSEMPPFQDPDNRIYKPGVIEDGQRILKMWYETSPNSLGNYMSNLLEQGFDRGDAVRYLLFVHYAGAQISKNDILTMNDQIGDHFIGFDQLAKMGVNMDVILALRNSLKGGHVVLSRQAVNAFNLMNLEFPGPYRVVRGGSWENSAEDVRSASRNIIWPNPLDSASKIGFRLVRNVQ